MAGGYALSGRGPLWARIASGVVALSIIPIWALTVTSLADPGLALDTPRCAWVALCSYSLLAIVMRACAIRIERCLTHDAAPAGRGSRPVRTLQLKQAVA